jgi:5-methylcytosine-specific restriction endonuclease McrA
VQFSASAAFVGKIEEAQALLSHSHPGASCADVLALALDEFLDTLRTRRTGARRSKAKRTGLHEKTSGTSSNSPPAEPASQEQASPISAHSPGPLYEQAPAAIPDPPAHPERRAETCRPGGVQPTPEDATLLEECPPQAPHSDSDRDAASDTALHQERVRSTRPTRHVSSRVRRAVWERDRGRCTYVDAEGRRCEATHFLQWDHIVPWAVGGPSTMDNIRLLCHTHNQHAARESFGAATIDKHRAVYVSFK